MIEVILDFTNFLSRPAISQQSDLGGGSAHLSEISSRRDLYRELSPCAGQRDRRHIGNIKV